MKIKQKMATVELGSGHAFDALAGACCWIVLGDAHERCHAQEKGPGMVPEEFDRPHARDCRQSAGRSGICDTRPKRCANPRRDIRESRAPLLQVWAVQIGEAVARHAAAPVLCFGETGTSQAASSMPFAFASSAIVKTRRNGKWPHFFQFQTALGTTPSFAAAACSSP